MHSEEIRRIYDGNHRHKRFNCFLENKRSKKDMALIPLIEEMMTSPTKIVVSLT